jgi:mannose-6-phosphate isomerase-like protein (cupin superfamily)
MKILDPRDVQPTINPASPEHVSGRQVHRRILSVLAGGPASIDVGYNTFKSGIEIAEPYAYNRDEFCYMVAGEMELLNEGVPVVAAGGSFVYRPAQAATHRVRVPKDAISICAFSPARIDGWSHRLPADAVGHWDGDEADRPIVQVVPIDERPQGEHPWSQSAGRIDFREIVATPDFRLAWAGLDPNAQFTRPAVDRDEVWFVVTGSLAIGNSTHPEAAATGRFVIWNPDDCATRIEASSDCTLAIYSARSSVGRA